MTDLVIVTGASRGIGLAIARRFLTRGAGVWNLSRTTAGVDGISEASVDLSVVGCENALPDSIFRQVKAADRTILVHNASTMINDSVDSVDAAELRCMLAVGVEAPAALNRVLLPVMARGSSIVYLGSTLSEKAVPGSFSYVTVKHAVIGMMRATCQDLLDRGIHTICVCPGVTDTEMLREHTGGNAELLATLSAMTGAGRLIHTDEIARIVELAADNPVLNGAVLHANYGQRER